MNNYPTDLLPCPLDSNHTPLYGLPGRHLGEPAQLCCGSSHLPLGKGPQQAGMTDIHYKMLLIKTGSY